MASIVSERARWQPCPKPCDFLAFTRDKETVSLSHSLKRRLPDAKNKRPATHLYSGTRVRHRRKTMRIEGARAAAHQTRQEAHPAVLHIPQDRSSRTRHGVRSVSADASNNQRYRVSPKWTPVSGNICGHCAHRNRARHLLLLRTGTALWNARQTAERATEQARGRLDQ